MRSEETIIATNGQWDLEGRARVGIGIEENGKSTMKGTQHESILMHAQLNLMVGRDEWEGKVYGEEGE